MIETLQALAASLEPLKGTAPSLRIYVQEAPPNAPVPFVVVAVNQNLPHREQREDGEAPAFSGQVAVTTTAGTTLGSMALGEAARKLLSPGAFHSGVPGTKSSIRWLRHEFTGQDKDVVIPGTKQFPSYTVNTYEVIS